MKARFVNSRKFLASSAHAGWAAACLMACIHHNLNPWLVFALFTVYAFLKEFWADAVTILPYSGWWENDTVGDSCLDFVTYEVGLGLAAIASTYLFLGMGLSVAYLFLMAYLLPETNPSTARR